MRFYLLTGFLIFALLACSRIKYTYYQPRYIYDGLETISLNDVQMDSSKINTLMEKILNNEYQNIHSVLILKDNKMICEEYFCGYTFDKQHIVKSLGKSIVSTLIGLAIDNDYIKNSDVLLKDLLPQYQSYLGSDPKKLDIKLKHILTMSTGLDCGRYDEYPNNCGAKMWLADDPIKYILDLPLSHDPGEHFLYNDGTPAILQVIITQNTKMRYDHFRNKFLFIPLAISTEPNRKGMTSREMAKIGLLYLNKGKWNKKQIVSSQWIEESTEKQFRWKNGHYGYLWWISTLSYRDTELETYYAAGNGGQFIFVIPDLNMVAVFTGGNYNNMQKTIQPISMLEEFILPAIM